MPFSAAQKQVFIALTGSAPQNSGLVDPGGGGDLISIMPVCVCPKV